MLERLYGDGQVAGVTFLPRVNEQLRKRFESLCERGLATISIKDEVVNQERQEQRETSDWFDNLLRKMAKDLLGEMVWD